MVGSWPGTAPANCGRPVYPAWRNAQLAVYDPAAFVWYFDTNGDGHINTMPFNGVYDAAPISYGFAGGIPVAGSWDGMASDGIGIFKDGVWYLRHSDGTTETRFFGAAGDKPFVVPVVVGTSAVIAVYRPSTHMVYLAIPDGSGNGFTAVDPFAGMAPPAWLSWPGSDPRPSALMNSTGGWGYAIFDRAIGWWTFGAANPARPNGVSLGVAGDYEMVGMNPCYGERIPN